MYSVKLDGKFFPKVNETESCILYTAQKLSKYGRCLVEVYMDKEKKVAAFLRGTRI